MTLDNPALPFRVMAKIWQAHTGADNSQAAKAKVSMQVAIHADTQIQAKAERKAVSC